MLYILRFLHQTTTLYENVMANSWLYILRFLHQTTTADTNYLLRMRCISCVFYIKPQRHPKMPTRLHVVYLAFSTSNHNYGQDHHNQRVVVYLAFSTSNHNSRSKLYLYVIVVYLAFSTSNHNTNL